MQADKHQITGILLKASEGRADAISDLMELVYQELHRMASNFMRRERADLTLRTTGLVHEAYLRLIDDKRVKWENRAHFFGIAAQAMRRILVDYARKHKAQKRGGGQKVLPLEEVAELSSVKAEELLALDEALKRLQTLDERQTRVVELRFFAGLTIEETAQTLGISPATVKREWAMAKAWLYREVQRARK
ncbi:sigma-70 family RNA polymerase sigma factor [Candidatus Parcubacteria bacterium]|nr:MAG: sigma-70 family RNA polymerase sigma factor [Candidatus Parcubacteria bacterium]